jgi:hypothetical protein
MRSIANEVWLGPAVTALVVACFICCVGATASAKEAQPGPKLPTLTVQLVVQAGQIGIDSPASAIHLGDHAAAYRACGLDTEGMKRELIAYLDAITKANGKLLTQLAMMSVAADDPNRARERSRIEARLDERARTEDDTAALWRDSHDWVHATQRVHAWVQATRTREPRLFDADRELSDIFELVRNNPVLADGPLLAVQDDPEGAGRLNAGRGIAVFEIAPPLVRSTDKVRPTANIGQWDALRKGFGDDALKRVECRLWHRDRVISELQDYASVRGIAFETYRTPADVKDSQGLAVATDRPDDRAAIRAERPQFSDKDYGGRIHLDPDPLLEAVYVRGEAADRALVERVLYLLLPSTDFELVRRNSEQYLCTAEAFWMQGESKRPSAIQLPLDEALRAKVPTLKGHELAIGRIYMTRRELALRLQRLAAIGYEARLDMAHELVPSPPADPASAPSHRPAHNPKLRLAILIIEPRADASPTSTAGPQPPFELKACSTPRDLPAALPVCKPGAGDSTCAAPLSVAEHAETAQPATPRAANTRQPLRNHVELSADHRAGKPLRWGASYRHEGLGADDSFVLGVGEQGQASGDFSYSSDFVGFGLLHRRVQLTARAYSAFDPSRGIDETRPDERREGAEVRATVDLWRDVAGTFGQAELGLSRTDIELKSAGAATQSSRVTLADAALVVVRSREGTPASPHHEAVITLARGRADGHGFNKAGLDWSMHRFVGAFERWDLRVHVHAVSAGTPPAEYISFGGEDTVRGYRSDRTAARRVWAVQNEYWMPLRWPFGSESLERTLRRKLAVAALIDVGDVRESLTSFSGRKTGVGLGLRYNHEDALTMRLDVAHPVGSEIGADRRMRLYFTVSTRRIL